MFQTMWSTVKRRPVLLEVASYIQESSTSVPIIQDSISYELFDDFHAELPEVGDLNAHIQNILMMAQAPKFSPRVK